MRALTYSLLLFVSAYIVGGGLGQQLALIPGVMVTFWPPAGILLATLLLTSPRSWPLWLISAGVAELICNAIWFHNPLPFALIYFAGNALASLTAAGLIRRFAPKPFGLDSFEQVAAFVILGACAAPCVSATVIATTDAILGRHSFWTAWSLVWLGDSSGLLVSAPLALTLVQTWQRRHLVSPARAFEAVAVMATLVVVGILALRDYLPTAYVMMPPLLWAAARFHVRGAAVGLAIVALVTAGFGIVARQAPIGELGLLGKNVVGLQAFLFISAVSALFVAGLAIQRERALIAVQQLNAGLETAVAERTETLRQREHFLRTITDVAPGVIHVYDLDARRSVFINRTVASLVGYSPDEVRSLCDDTPKALMHPDDLPRFDEHIGRLRTLRDDEVAEFTHRMRTRSGEWRWFHSRDAVFARDASGRVTQIVGTAIDVTDRRRAEDALRASEQRFRLALQHTPILVYTCDRELRYTWIYNNPSRFDNYNVLGKRDDEILPLDHVADLMSLKREVIETGAPTRREVRFPFKGRTEYWYVSAEPVRDEVGSTTGLTVAAMDVTEARLADEALRASESRMQLAMLAGNAATWDLDLVTGVNIWSESHFHQLGLEPTADRRATEDIWRSAVFPEDWPRVLAEWERAVQTRTDFRSEHRLRRADNGSVIHAQAVGRFIYDQTSCKPVRFVGVSYDITRLKRAEQALRDADRRKDEFLATLAHELRNPLAPLRNGLEILKRSTDGANQDLYGPLDRQVRQMTRLVDDLLDVGRISQDKLELRRERLELNSVIRHAIETVQPKCEQYQHQMDVTLPDEPLYVDGDAARLTQVFGNLLTNACKFTPVGGRIWLTATPHAHDVVVTVRDSGLGIPPDMLDRVFEMFTQVGRSVERTAGLGIGLHLVKRLVEMHGGTVAGASDGDGKGSTFTVVLPLLAVQSESTQPPATAPTDTYALPEASRRRILVVDDNHDSARTMSLLLKLEGNDTATAHDGEEAIRVSKAYKPDVVLLDIGLPGMDGYAACRAIKTHDCSNTPTLIALTGWGQEADRKKAADAGFDHHFVKPVDFDVLKKVLAEADARRAS